MSVELLYVSDAAFSRHSTGDLHPERPARLRAAERGVEESGAHLVRMEGTEATDEDLARIHNPEYVRAIERFCLAGVGHLDPDTIAGPDSFRAARLAAGSGPAAVELMRRQNPGPAFLAVRPPGHHALADRAMGFCLFNNVAVTAAAITTRGERVAIVDWDVHHGNGTEDSFAGDPAVLYLSVRQHPFYPGTGDPAATEHLLPPLYEELKRLARRQLAGERADHTLGPTALVHEAFLRLVDPQHQANWQSRRHFFGAAAEAMRRILVDCARRKGRLKRE